MTKNLSNKYSQKLADSAQKPSTDAIKTASIKTIQKAAAIGDLIGKKAADKITNLSKNLLRNYIPWSCTHKMMKLMMK